MGLINTEIPNRTNRVNPLFSVPSGLECNECEPVLSLENVLTCNIPFVAVTDEQQWVCGSYKEHGWHSGYNVVELDLCVF